ncbi:MAG: DUF1573 domain-containing protein, partial [Planctomycetota bacterium]|nr:DUF1573 domain-containing protein [Planctomycetota bacterium]
MRTSQIIATIVAVFMALTVTIWIAFWVDTEDVESSDTPNAPEVNQDGPFPKVVVDNERFDFGDMLIGDEQSHNFVITNQGEAPLILKKGSSTCVCTVAELQGDALPVGESVGIKLTWSPKARSPVFDQNATILTNDPEKREIRLAIHGQVHNYINSNPEEHWDMGKVMAGSANSITPTMFSTIVDDFVIESFECDLPQIDCTWHPMTRAELTDVEGLVGYQIRVTAADGIKVGPFQTKISFKIKKS